MLSIAVILDNRVKFPGMKYFKFLIKKSFKDQGDFPGDELDFLPMSLVLFS